MDVPVGNPMAPVVSMLSSPPVTLIPPLAVINPTESTLVTSS